MISPKKYTRQQSKTPKINKPRWKSHLDYTESYGEYQSGSLRGAKFLKRRYAKIINITGATMYSTKNQQTRIAKAHKH